MIHFKITTDANLDCVFVNPHILERSLIVKRLENRIEIVNRPAGVFRGGHQGPGSGYSLHQHAGTQQRALQQPRGLEETDSGAFSSGRECDG